MNHRINFKNFIKENKNLINGIANFNTIKNKDGKTVVLKNDPWRKLERRPPMSREIDKLVAIHIIGYRENHHESKIWLTDKGCKLRSEFNPSTDIAAALEIIEKEKDNYERIEVSWYNGKVNVIFWLTDIEPVCSAEADTAPMAICLASLKAKGVEE